MYKVLLKIFFCLGIVKNEAAKILGVFPTPSISHQIVFRPVMYELAKRGHEVVVITPNPVFYKDSKINIKVIDVHNVSYTLWNRFAGINKGQENELHDQLSSAFDLLNDVFEAQMKSADVQKFIKDHTQKFDLMFMESCIRASLGFVYFYNVPVVEFSSLAGMFGTYDRVGAANHRLFYPAATRQKIYNLTLWEKISELYTQFSIDYLFQQHEVSENNMLKRVFGPKIPDLKVLQKNIEMVFLNVHPIWDSNRPVPPNVIYLGGLHQNPKKELPKDLQTYLNNSRDGVIYMSFGTNVQPSLLSPEAIQIFTKVFSRLPYNILWKWDKETLPGKPKNVKISKWFPQSDLLKHPKIKLFITQGGLQSTDESITAGVPLIAIPMLGDQWFNAEQYIGHGIGTKLSVETLSESKLQETIETVIGNNSYRENVIRLSKIIQDQQQSPVQRAVWWTEYMLRHGGAKHLRAAAAGLHWTEYYMLDLVLAIASVLLATIVIIALSIRFIVVKFKQTKCTLRKMNNKNMKKIQ